LVDGFADLDRQNVIEKAISVRPIRMWLSSPT